jgi:hypothetical protein
MIKLLRSGHDTGISTKDMSTAEKMYWGAALQAGVNAAKPQPPENPLDTSRKSQFEMESMLQTDPEGLGKWIEVGDDGRYKMKPKPVPSAGSMFSSAIPQSALDEWTVAAKRAFPNQFAPTTPSPNNPPPPPTATPSGGRGGFTQTPDQVPDQFTPIPRGQGAVPPNITAPQNQIPQAGGQTQIPQTQTRRLSPEQQQQQTTGLANGTLIRIQDARSGKFGIIPNTYQDIQEAMQKGWNVVKGK